MTGRAPLAMSMNLYRGMQVHLCRNVNKKSDPMNGMEASVMGYDASSRCVHVDVALLLVVPAAEFQGAFLAEKAFAAPFCNPLRTLPDLAAREKTRDASCEAAAPGRHHGQRSERIEI